MRRLILAAALAAGCAPAAALETDQYWGFGRPLRDATAVVNAKVNLEIERALAEINASGSGRSLSCEQVTDRIAHGFRFPFFQKIETWAIASPLVDRVPATREEERTYRETSKYARTFKGDVVRWMPLSPTIEAQGVRFGTDKLSHFFSQGASYHRVHRKELRRGLSPEEAERRAILVGTFPERTVLGFTSSGVLSLADLEANYQGMRFYDGLCFGQDPALVLEASGWVLRRPFDLGHHVDPDWDESWQPCVYTKGRWKKVIEGLRSYCGLLDDPEFQARRAAYARRDADSVADDVVRDLVKKGKLPDPEGFTLEKACGRGAEEGAGSR